MTLRHTYGRASRIVPGIVLGTLLASAALPMAGAPRQQSATVSTALTPLESIADPYYRRTRTATVRLPRSGTAVRLALTP